MQAAPPTDGLILVTGATGFIGTHAIKQLLEKGYRVRGTVRSLTKDPKLMEQLRTLVTNPRHPLDLVEADLTKDAGWDEAVAGCSGVFHIAAHVAMVAPDPQRDIVDPSIRGVQRVFEACARAKTVRRVVLTSSVAAICHIGSDTKVFTEEDWNEGSTLANNPYPYAKTQAERWAWQFVRQQPPPFELQTICPSLVMGPALTRQASSSLELFVRFLSGSMPMVPAFGWSTVDVRDVARAHVLAYEQPGQGGNRFIVSDKEGWLLDLAIEFKRQYPNYPVPTHTAPGFFLYLFAMWDSKLSWATLNANLNVLQRFNAGKSRTVLGLTYTPLEQSVKDTVEALVQVGLVKKR